MTSPADVPAAKREARRAARAARAAVASQLSPAEAGAAVAARVLERMALTPGTVVSAFWPMGDELDLRGLLHTLHARGCVPALPVVMGKGRPLLFRDWAPGALLKRSSFGVEEPGEDRPAVLPEVSLVPLLAFDREGYRLGYGGGFYDRTIAGRRRASPTFRAIGVAFAGQEVARVPRDQFDERLDAVATDREFIGVR